MTPVAGNPPKSGEKMFATPCPINSTLGLCLSPLVRSATTADISDSIAPSIAMVTAGESRCNNRLGFNVGTARCGNPLGMPPNRAPIVSTGIWNNATAAVAPKHTRIAPGIRLKNLTQMSITASDAMPPIDAARFSV
jgi:hypothetical protein